MYLKIKILVYLRGCFHILAMPTFILDIYIQVLVSENFKFEFHLNFVPQTLKLLFKSVQKINGRHFGRKPDEIFSSVDTLMTTHSLSCRS